MKKKNPNGFATKTDIQGVKKDIKNVKEATLFPREINRIDTLLNK